MMQDSQPSIPGLPSAAQPASEGATLQPAPDAGGPPPGGGGGSLLFFLPLIGILILMMVLSGRAQKKEQKKKAELISSLRKHDRVQSIGGIIGTISEIRDDEVVLIIDEQNKTRLRLAKSAVQQVLRSAAGGEPTPGDEATTPELASQAAS
ncbi:MAG: preprotein translocase subunit YajC [Phycisphaerales bacterium]